MIMIKQWCNKCTIRERETVDGGDGDDLRFDWVDPDDRP